MNSLNPLTAELFERYDPARALGMNMGHRMTVVHLSEESGGGLWIHSPVVFSEELWDELDQLCHGETRRHLIIPSRTHDLHLEPWLERIPPETTYAPAALQRAHPGWRIGQTLTNELLAPWSREFAHVRLEGAPRVNEVAFLHRPTKTLILVDSVFNLRGSSSFLGGLLLGINGCREGIATSRLFRLMIKDKAAFAASLSLVLEWDFERVLVGHGAILEADEVPALRAHLASF